MYVRTPAGTTVSTLTPVDIPGALRLVEEKGWNQVRADWELFMELGAVLKVTAPDGGVAATAAILPFPPRFGWIGMVLVAAGWQRKGIATALLQSCSQLLRERGLVPVLDATPGGREVYLPLGFKDGWPIRRWRREGGGAGAEMPRPEGVRPLRDGDWPQVLELDAAAFGADRLSLLRRLAVRSRGFSCAMERDGRIVGYLLGREGRVATQLGPIVADDEATALSLLACALPRIEGAVIVDALDRHATFVRQLEACGFVVERNYTRMAQDLERSFGDSACVIATAGPELG